MTLVASAIFLLSVLYYTIYVYDILKCLAPLHYQPRKFYLNPWATSKRQKSFLSSGPTHRASLWKFLGNFSRRKKWNQGHLSCQFAYKTNANGILLVPCYVKTKNSTYLNFGNYATINGNLNHCDMFCHVIETLKCYHSFLEFEWYGKQLVLSVYTNHHLYACTNLISLDWKLGINVGSTTCYFQQT